jgi:hypothetical protein
MGRKLEVVSEALGNTLQGYESARVNQWNKKQYTCSPLREQGGNDSLPPQVGTQTGSNWVIQTVLPEWAG